MKYQLHTGLGILLTALALCIWPTAIQAAGATANFQTVVTDSSGHPRASQAVELRVELTRDNLQGQTQYAETHVTQTDAQGIAGIVIGKGLATDPKYVFDNFDIAKGDNFIRVSIKEAGGWRLLLNSQLPNVGDMRGWLFADEKHNAVIAIMIVVWLGIVVYLLLAGRKMKQLSQRVAELKQGRGV